MDKSGKKDFSGWIEIKKKIHEDGKVRNIREGEVWWCAIGENVGSEICGKGKTFARPVLIIKKLSQLNFIGIPLTSKKHKGSWYVEFEFKKKVQIAVVAQVENVSVYRLYGKMGEVPNSDLELVRNGLGRLLIKNIP